MKKKIRKNTVLGLTGGIATGKSLLLGIFKRCGCDIIDSDKIVHRILDRRIVKSRIVKAFGSNSLNKQKKINRKALGNLVFNDKKKLKILENIIHPEVLCVIKKTIKSQKNKIIIADVPLLYEKKWENYFDQIVLAWCPKDIQIKRLQDRNKITYMEALKRIRLQGTLSIKKMKAKYVVNTDKKKKFVEKQVKLILSKCQGD
ncbi:MAG: dephospho-CoA kinase [bacterium]